MAIGMLGRIVILAVVYISLLPEVYAFDRFPLVSTHELKTMLEERHEGTRDFVLVNTLDELIYRDQSIPGSINIPWSQIEQRHGELGPDKEKLIVTYCIGFR